MNRSLLHRTLIGLLCILIMLLLVRLINHFSQKHPVAVRPADTKRYRQRRTLLPKATRSQSTHQGSKSTNKPSVKLHMVLYKPGKWKPRTQRGVLVEPQEYWPTEDEAPWPDIDSSRSLQRLTTIGEENTVDVVDDLLADAKADGLFESDIEDLVDDPWKALVAMQASHIQEVITGGIWDCTGKTDHTRSLDIAIAIEKQWTDDPVADYARLHMIWVQASHCHNLHDPQAAATIITDVVQTTADPVVLEAAVSLISEVAEDIEESDLQQITESWDEVSIETQEVIAYIWIERSLALQNSKQVDFWSKRLDKVISKICQIEPDDCEGREGDWDHLQAFRSSKGYREPETWREEIMAAIHQCHQEEPIQTKLHATGHWKEGWQWSDWSKKSPLIKCFAEQNWIYQPEEDIELLLQVLLR